jgi:hypothetical protein
MQAEQNGSPKLMFVLAAAFGELFNAMYMVVGCSFRTAFAMREPWYSLNRASLPGPSYRIDDLASLLAAIDQENPDLVCLFSAYLYPDDRIVDFGDLDRLVKYLNGRGTKTVTSDPFLGLISRLPPFDLESPVGQIVGLPMRLIGEAVFGSRFTYFVRARYILKDLPHVYIVDPDERGIKALPFYNPNIRSYASDSVAARQAATASLPAQPYWLFVLGASDYYPQIKREGADHFHASLARKLLDAMQEGRRAALIAPSPCIAALQRDASLKECIFVDNSQYDRFMAILLGAEYVFYWNIFSASVIARLLNRLPTFFFAVGHIADENQQIFEKGMSCYYRGGRPTHLHPAERLTAALLSGLAHAQEEQLFEPFYNNVRQLPTPEMLVRNVLAER